MYKRQPSDREAVYRFRYDEYIVTYGRHSSAADHEQKTLTEDHDDRTILLMIKDHLRGDIIGTVSILPSRFPSNITDYLQLSNYPVLGDLSTTDNKHIHYVSRLLVRKDQSSLKLASLLIEKAFIISVSMGCLIAFIHAAKRAGKMFERYGFIFYGDPFSYEGMPQLQYPLFVDTTCLGYFNSINSPFSKHIRNSTFESAPVRHKFSCFTDKYLNFNSEYL